MGLVLKTGLGRNKLTQVPKGRVVVATFNSNRNGPLVGVIDGAKIIYLDRDSYDSVAQFIPPTEGYYAVEVPAGTEFIVQR